MRPVSTPPVLTIDGRRITYQGIARMRANMNVEDAAKATAGNGQDEMIVTVRGADGRAQRVVVWGDQLDFAYRKNAQRPVVMLDGRAAMIVHAEDEQVGLTERIGGGLTSGLRNGLDALADLARKALAEAPTQAGMAAAGMIGLTLFAKEAAVQAVKNGVIVLGPALVKILGAGALGAAALIALAATFKAMVGREAPKLGTIAGIIDDEAPLPGPATGLPRPNR